MEFVIDRPWKFDEKLTHVLNIVQLVDLNHISNALQSLEKQLTRTIGYIGGGPISLHVLIPKSAYVPNERMPVQLIVTNNSRTPVDKVKFVIYKIVEYHSLSPVTVSKREVLKIVKKEAGGVHRKTEQRYEHVIDIPNLVPSDEFSPSRIIKIKYELKVEAKISGLFKNLIVSMPLILGSVPHNGTISGISILPTNNISSVGLARAIYPNLSTIGFNLNRLSLDSDTDTTASLSAQNIPVSPSASMASMSSSLTSSIASPQHTAELPNRYHPDTSATIQPSAPPLELCPGMTTEAPPTYDEVFSSPSSMSSGHRSMYQITNPSLKSTGSSNIGKV